MEAVKEEKRSLTLGPGRLKTGEHTYVQWNVYVPIETIKEDLVDKDFWSIHAERFRVHDEVRVIRDDGAWLARCLVLQTTRSWTKMKLLQFIELEEVQDLGESAFYEVQWRGGHWKWCVIRKADGEVIKKELPSRDEAHTWMIEHEKL